MKSNGQLWYLPAMTSGRLKHSQSRSHNHAQMASSCRVHPGGYLSLPVSRPSPQLLHRNRSWLHGAARVDARSPALSLQNWPIRGRHDDASESSRRIAAPLVERRQRRFAYVEGPVLCCQQGGRYGYIVAALTFLKLKFWFGFAQNTEPAAKARFEACVCRH